MLRLSSGDLWFGGMTIVRMPTGQLGQPRSQDEPLDYEAFSIAGGLASDEVPLGHPTLAADSQGAVWVATLKGVARFDARQAGVEPARPLIYLTDVTIGRTTRRADEDIVLAPGTSHVRIGFGAVEVTAPEKIRLQYRLDGVDSEWLDAGPDQQATFSTLPVGTHTLRIRATDRLGVWDRQGVAFRVTQQPFFHQTTWFHALVGLTLAAAAAALYRLRVRHLARIMSARFDERLAERTRVARDLHDTLMQTVQGSKLLADHALRHTADRARMASALEQLSVWLARASEEGRAALNSLRSGMALRDDLADAFRRALDECRGGGAALALSVHGATRPIHPAVRDEVYRIGYEAIRNACVHSGAARVDVHLDYGHGLTLRVQDDGSGIAPDIVEAGRDGHFGLRGMRERAERIGARFELVSSPGAGTRVSVAVPGAVAFDTAPSARGREGE
jgi:signal transduction histidine kinase